MNNKTVLLVLWLACYLGYASANNEPRVNGTLFYNVTGIIKTRVEHTRDILDHDNNCYKEIMENLTRGFERLFSMRLSFEFDVSVIDAFVWLTPQKIEENEESTNLSFVMIAKYSFYATPKEKHTAETMVKNIFWQQIHYMPKDEGYVTLQGLKMKYATFKEITREEVNITIEIINNYMSFITKLSRGDARRTETEDPESIAITCVAYVGIGLSVTGSLVTMVSICYFRKLRKFRGNQILVNICLTVMIGMLLSILSFTYREKGKICQAIAILLHYFILAALLWMCVEAYNLYRDLVKVFNTGFSSTQRYFIRASLFAYGIPAIVVSIVVSIDVDIYGQRIDACWMTSKAFVISFLTPVLFVVFVNIFFFVLIMREIVQVSQRDVKNIKPSLRAAISLSVLLGFCWIFAGVSTFVTNPLFQYVFVVLSSFQGFFIFLFHGIGKKELRDSWKSLSVFNWRFRGFTSSESQGRGKTESTQDTPLPVKRPSVIGASAFNPDAEKLEVETGKMSATARSDTSSEAVRLQKTPLKNNSLAGLLEDEHREACDPGRATADATQETTRVGTLQNTNGEERELEDQGYTKGGEKDHKLLQKINYVTNVSV